MASYINRIDVAAQIFIGEKRTCKASALPSSGHLRQIWLFEL